MDPRVIQVVQILRHTPPDCPSLPATLACHHPGCGTCLSLRPVSRPRASHGGFGSAERGNSSNQAT